MIIVPGIEADENIKDCSSQVDPGHGPNIIANSPPHDYRTTESNLVIDSSYTSHSEDGVQALFSTWSQIPIDTNPITINIICFSAIKAAKFANIKIKYVPTWTEYVYCLKY